VVLAQYDGVTTWAFRYLDTAPDRYAVTTGGIVPAEREEFVSIPADGWHHVAVASREDGRAVVWLDGVRKLDGRLQHQTAPSSRWLSVGNTVKGTSSGRATCGIFAHSTGCCAMKKSARSAPPACRNGRHTHSGTPPPPPSRSSLPPG